MCALYPLPSCCDAVSLDIGKLESVIAVNTFRIAYGRPRSARIRRLVRAALGPPAKQSVTRRRILARLAFTCRSPRCSRSRRNRASGYELCFRLERPVSFYRQDRPDRSCWGLSTPNIATYPGLSRPHTRKSLSPFHIQPSRPMDARSSAAAATADERAPGSAPSCHTAPRVSDAPAPRPGRGARAELIKLTTDCFLFEFPKNESKNQKEGQRDGARARAPSLRAREAAAACLPSAKLPRVAVLPRARAPPSLDSMQINEQAAEVDLTESIGEEPMGNGETPFDVSHSAFPPTNDSSREQAIIEHPELTAPVEQPVATNGVPGDDPRCDKAMRPHINPIIRHEREGSSHAMSLHMNHNTWHEREGTSRISFLRRALERWSAHWGVSWVRLPAGHHSKKILSEQPEDVPPDVPWMDERPM